MKTNRGGARKGAGRKKSKNKKQRVELWIERLKIKELGGKEKTKQHLYRLLAVAPLTSNPIAANGWINETNVRQI